MALFTQKWDDHYDYIWPCDCSDIHYLTMSWNDKDPEWRFLSIADGWSSHRLRDRVKGAWKILRGRSFCASEIVLTEKVVNEVLDALSKHKNSPPSATSK